MIIVRGFIDITYTAPGSFYTFSGYKPLNPNIILR